MMRTRWLLVTVIFTLLGGIAGCGGDSVADGDSVQRVSQSSRNYSPDDFISVGFKQLKSYDVNELPGATAASFGFWRSAGQDAKDYELRFYSSHEVAVKEGTSLAEEVTGENAVLFTDDLTWKEGAKERRHQVAVSIQSGGELVPTFMDFSIHGNVVMLCEGLDSEQSLANCQALISELPG